MGVSALCPQFQCNTIARERTRTQHVFPL